MHTGHRGVGSVPKEGSNKPWQLRQYSVWPAALPGPDEDTLGRSGGRGRGSCWLIPSWCCPRGPWLEAGHCIQLTGGDAARVSTWVPPGSTPSSYSVGLRGSHLLLV